MKFLIAVVLMLVVMTQAFCQSHYKAKAEAAVAVAATKIVKEIPPAKATGCQCCLGERCLCGQICDCQCQTTGVQKSVLSTTGSGWRYLDDGRAYHAATGYFYDFDKGQYEGPVPIQPVSMGPVFMGFQSGGPQAVLC